MSLDQNLAKVKSIYRYFGEGDFESIFATLTEDVVWISHCDSIVPWSGEHSGKSGVKGFFDAIFTYVEVLGFEPTEFVAQGDTVVSMGTFDCKAYSTDKIATTKWIFVWKFRDDMVCSYEQFHDENLLEIFIWASSKDELARLVAEAEQSGDHPTFLID